MPENEFEKQVQQRLDSLQLRPSGEVWDEVERRIRRERKRRLILIWFAFAFLLLTGATSWYFYSSSKNIEQKIGRMSAAEKPAASPADQLHNFSANKPAIHTSNLPVGASMDSSVSAAQNPTASTRTVLTRKAKSAQSALTPEIVTAKTKHEAPSGRDGSNYLPQKNIEDDSRIGSATKQQSTEIPDTAQATSASVNHTTTEHDSISKKSAASNKKDTVQTRVITAASRKKGKQKHWELSVYATAGQSGLVKNFAAAFKRTESEPMLSPGGYPNAMIAASGRPQVPSPESRFAWQLGLTAKRSLSRRISLSAGIQVSQLTLQQKTGILFNGPSMSITSTGRDSTGRYYWNGTTADHLNHYTLVQLPVGIHWQLTNGKKAPLFWQNGLTPGFIVHSNAIIFDPATNIFYKDQKSTRSFQVAFNSGLYLRIANGSKHPLTIGASMDYHLGTLLKKPETPLNHLLGVGVRVGWTILQ